MAQAPAPSIGQHNSGSGDGQTRSLPSFGDALSGSSVGSHLDGGHLDRLRIPEFGARRLQDEQQQYSLTALFKQYHGEFMNRFERYDPSIELRGRLLPNQRINDEPGSFDLIGYDFDAEFPVVITTEAYLLFGLYQYGRHYKTSSPFGSANNVASASQEGSIGDETLTAAGVRLGFGWFLMDNLLLEVETSPGVYSDMEGTLHSKDLDFPSSALFTVAPTENFYFKFGARYNQVYEDAPWLPWLGFSWDITENFRIDLLAPEYIELSWWPTPSTSFALGTMVQGAQYHVRSTSSTGKQRQDVQVQEVITYFGLTHRFTDNFSLQARTGLVVAGDYSLTTGAATFDPAEGALDQGFYADVTFGIDW